LPTLKKLSWIIVGRLDINTSGLLLFTTNGELANYLMHPSNEIPREYEVEFTGNLDQRIIDRLINGVELEDGDAHVEQIKLQKNGCARMTLIEGRNRIVRRLFASQGLTVTSLRRLRFGKIMLPENLKVGEWRELNEREITNYKLRMTNYKW
jgi:23S rRNA pseudouridine2605 synthase